VIATRYAGDVGWQTRTIALGSALIGLACADRSLEPVCEAPPLVLAAALTDHDKDETRIVLLRDGNADGLLTLDEATTLPESLPYPPDFVAVGLSADERVWALLRGRLEGPLGSTSEPILLASLCPTCTAFEAGLVADGDDGWIAVAELPSGDHRVLWFSIRGELRDHVDLPGVRAFGLSIDEQGNALIAVGEFVLRVQPSGEIDELTLGDPPRRRGTNVYALDWRPDIGMLQAGIWLDESVVWIGDMLFHLGHIFTANVAIFAGEDFVVIATNREPSALEFHDWSETSESLAQPKFTLELGAPGLHSVAAVRPRCGEP
jgi:hypothetical protein